MPTFITTFAPPSFDMNRAVLFKVALASPGIYTAFPSRLTIQPCIVEGQLASGAGASAPGEARPRKDELPWLLLVRCCSLAQHWGFAFRRGHRGAEAKRKLDCATVYASDVVCLEVDGGLYPVCRARSKLIHRHLSPKPAGARIDPQHHGHATSGQPETQTEKEGMPFFIL